eukprot:6692736-Prymnesium_polylepis.1
MAPSRAVLVLLVCLPADRADFISMSAMSFSGSVHPAERVPAHAFDLQPSTFFLSQPTDATTPFLAATLDGAYAITGYRLSTYGLPPFVSSLFPSSWNVTCLVQSGQNTIGWQTIDQRAETVASDTYLPSYTPADTTQHCTQLRFDFNQSSVAVADIAIVGIWVAENTCNNIAGWTEFGL